MLDPRHITELASEAFMARRSIVGRANEVIDMLTRLPSKDIVDLSESAWFEFVKLSRAIDELRLAYADLETVESEIAEREREAGR